MFGRNLQIIRQEVSLSRQPRLILTFLYLFLPFFDGVCHEREDLEGRCSSYSMRKPILEQDCIYPWDLG